MNSAGTINFITPPNTHCNWLSVVRVGFLLDKTVGFPGVHGVGVEGIQGHPDITEQAPNGMTLNIGTLSMILPIGILLHKHGEGVALNTE